MKPIEPVASPWAETFEGFVRSIKREAVFVTPYITAQPLKRIVQAIQRDNLPRVLLLTNFAIDSLLQGSIDGKAIADFCREVPTTTVGHLPGLHAKAYVADEHTAIITSGNLTSGSLYRNYEYGIRINDPLMVRRISRDLQEYGNLGAYVRIDELDHIADVAASLRSKHSSQLNSARTNLRREFKKELENARESLMHLRGKSGESTNAIFMRTILYLLKGKPLTTTEMHPLISNIHPDLCDDEIDRVIGGVRFGKEWKHRVRGAQVVLRRKGMIELVEGRWRLVKK